MKKLKSGQYILTEQELTATKDRWNKVKEQQKRRVKDCEENNKHAAKLDRELSLVRSLMIILDQGSKFADEYKNLEPSELLSIYNRLNEYYILLANIFCRKYKGFCNFKEYCEEYWINVVEPYFGDYPDMPIYNIKGEGE